MLRLYLCNSNCLEQGHSREPPVFKERRCTASVPPQEFSENTPPQPLFPKLPLVFGPLRHYLDGLTSQILRLIPPLLLPILLCLPLYYLSQASELLENFDNCRNEYDQWIKASSDPIERPPVVNDNVDGGDFGSLQILNQNAVHTTLNEQDVTNTQSPREVITPPPITASPDSVTNYQCLWCNYLDSRIVEWRILTTTACVFVAASPTIFQIPEAGDDPITRSMAFLALCRALSGIIFGPIFLLYFRRSKVRGVHFALIWCQKVSQAQRPMTGGGRWSPWIMLSLPAVSTCWAALFYLFAIFSFIWRTGSIADPSPLSANNPGYHPMAAPLAIAVRIIITTATVVDIGCMMWVWRTLRSADLFLSQRSAT
ncbi:hypothetical protein BDZ94DRAFT_893872 [Collybia nuda]|uniref:Uncharacterized protein n=1 Tax=Collybia nuda TaxID=64659 RepID=A0A9P5Y0N3_9AGAR|nr:hypothetical protein BDZ94DRAFT_893872 [Collybia nuda]